MFYTILIIIYLAASVIICKIAEAKGKSAKAYFVAENTLKQKLLIPMLFAGMVGGTTITSAAATGYTRGLMGMVHVIGMCIGSFIFIKFVSRP